MTSLKKKAIFLPIIALLLIALVVANVIVSQYARVISRFLGGMSGDELQLTDSEQTALAESDALCQEMGEDSFVLLKNKDNALPLSSDVTNINVFGYGATDNGFLLRGVGSGSSTISNSAKVTLLTALKDAGFNVNEKVLAKYNGLTGVRPNSPNSSNVYSLNEPDVSVFGDVIDEAKTFSDVALFVLSRDGGENVGEIPSSYLKITAKEQATLNYLHQNFGTVIVLLNTTNTMHCGFLEDDTVDACLFVGITGQSAARAIPSILRGYKTEDGKTVDVYPSGKTSDTYVYSPTYDPTWANREPSSKSIQYAEDIYFGYKWYETADAEGFFDDVTNEYGSGYDGVVQFPFGYGLSYTSFKWTIKEISVSTGNTITEDTEFTIKVNVENTGLYPGKDVVQLYYTPTYVKGGIEKADVNLIDFAKTAELQPGQAQDVTLTCTAYELASYDCYDKNDNGYAVYEIDAGTFTLSLRTDAHTLADCGGREEMSYYTNEIIFDTDPTTDGEISNRLTGDSAYAGVPIDGSTAGITTKYLTRDNFKYSFPKTNSPTPNGSV
ncbi:MAG: glycoside hydrolase family 3 C-terminal domain-containing protein, partial [Clostridia bacterium]|nr:glycoside hydrolase family 3 C-terminal domain-containing protein [Clostridia bacterium]